MHNCSPAVFTEGCLTQSAVSRRLTSSADLGPRLRRGYQGPQDGATSQQVDTKAEAIDDAAAQQPIELLLLVVHGIGQNLSGEDLVVSYKLCLLAAPLLVSCSAVQRAACPAGDNEASYLCICDMGC